MKEFVLASASPRRKELLNQIGIKFRTCTSKKEEEILRNMPEDIVKDLSYTKARDVYERGNRDAVVIGADTIVVADEKVLGKPKDEEEAFEMMKADLQALNADVKVEQEEYEEVVAIKPMFLVAAYE